ncbi:MAG: hypothetical protein KJ720_04090 [Proteobacteria bacterium]|nr:hypothetical protein [Pseudomonadota bacterium]MBU1452041.1 hypothetical protein [Pseudomonadota bacterium]MBU2467748.1 hypothetical protein [Pseudomonadota bacterium]
MRKFVVLIAVLCAVLAWTTPSLAEWVKVAQYKRWATGNCIDANGKKHQFKVVAYSYKSEVEMDGKFRHEIAKATNPICPDGSQFRGDWSKKNYTAWKENGRYYLIRHNYSGVVYCGSKKLGTLMVHSWSSKADAQNQANYYFKKNYGRACGGQAKGNWRYFTQKSLLPGQ